MHFRNLLLGVGVISILIGAVIAVVLIARPPSATPGGRGVTGPTVVMVAARPIPAGALLRQSDIGWRELKGGAPPGAQRRDQVSEAQIVGSLTRRSFTAGEIIPDNGLIGPRDRDFLAAVLTPGRRAVTIALDPARSASGLILPNDRVDVILVQDFADKSGQASPAATAAASVAQILLHDVRVVAVGDAFVRPGPTPEGATGQRGDSSAAARTITLELADLDAQRLLVAQQVGKVDLALRALVHATDEPAEADRVVWGAEIAPAGFAAAPRPQPLALPAGATGSPAGGAPARRSPEPIRIIRGSKVETP